MSHQIQGSQNDFSAGEVDVSLKRNDVNPARKYGARQMSNFRILDSKSVQNRPGRTVRYFDGGRVEQVLMSPGNIFDLVFGVGYLSVYNAAGTRVFTTNYKADGLTPIPWGSADLGGITWAVYGLSIYIAYAAGAPNNVPQVLTWDGVSQTSAWTLSTYAEAVTAGGQKRTLFYRISPPNITLLPSGQSGSINITFSGPVLKSAAIGSRLSYCGRQLTITGVTDSQHGTATVNEPLLFGTLTLTFGTADPTGIFTIGDEVIGNTSGAKGIVVQVNGNPTNTIVVQSIPPNTAFVNAEICAGPGGTLKITTAPSSSAPAAVSVWNDEAMNAYRGYPTSVTVDQGRLVFSNFPGVPSGIAWSTIGVLTDFYVEPTIATASTASAIFEIAPGKSQVLYVLAGMESSEFVFCDNAIYFIAITPQNPLVPGSVGFVELAANGCYPNVQPRRTEQTIIYLKAGGLTVGAVQAPGAYNRPFIVDSVSDLYSHLFQGKTPLSIAIPSATTQFSENYIYVAFSDGTVAVGKYGMRNGLLQTNSEGSPSIGWVPWSGVGTVSWVAALNAAVIFATGYPAGFGTSISAVEVLDDSRYLDSSVLVNNLPAALTPPGGKGPLWWLAGGSVTLMDQGTRMMGTYQIDGNGFIIPQGNAGENLLAATLVAGQPWTSILEPFAQDAPSGQDIHQRMLPRRISYYAAYVIHSSGFYFAKLFSSKLTPTSPALGAVVNIRRVPAWNMGDDPTQPPPSRETVEEWRPSGYSYDPRVAIIKDTPGPLLIQEVAVEISI